MSPRADRKHLSKAERREFQTNMWKQWTEAPPTTREKTLVTFQCPDSVEPTVGQARKHLADAVGPPPDGIKWGFHIYSGSFMGYPDMADDQLLFQEVADVRRHDDGLGDDGTRIVQLSWTLLTFDHEWNLGSEIRGGGFRIEHAELKAAYDDPR